jgi:hypothetical protein
MNTPKLHIAYTCMWAWKPDTAQKKLDQNCTGCWDKFTRWLKKYIGMDSKRNIKLLGFVCVHAYCLFIRTYCVESAKVLICSWIPPQCFLVVFPSALLKTDHVICNCSYKLSFRIVILKILVRHNCVNDHSQIHFSFLLMVCIWGVCFHMQRFKDLHSHTPLGIRFIYLGNI